MDYQVVIMLGHVTGVMAFIGFCVSIRYRRGWYIVGAALAFLASMTVSVAGYDAMEQYQDAINTFGTMTS